MEVSIKIVEPNISINGMNLRELLSQVYNQGKLDAQTDSNDGRITFVNLSKELAAKGRKISVRTLTNRAKEANVKTFRFDGNRLACRRIDIKHFIDL